MKNYLDFAKVSAFVLKCFKIIKVNIVLLAGYITGKSQTGSSLRNKKEKHARQCVCVCILFACFLNLRKCTHKQTSGVGPHKFNKYNK